MTLESTRSRYVHFSLPYHLSYCVPQPSSSCDHTHSYHFQDVSSQTRPYESSQSSTDYASSPADGYEASSYFAPSSSTDPDPPRGLITLYTQPVNNSTYSSLKHALDDPSPLTPIISYHADSPAAASPSHAEVDSVHPSDEEEPPMGFLRPDSPVFSPGSDAVDTPFSEPLRTPALTHALPVASTLAALPTLPAKRVHDVVLDAAALSGARKVR
jgi:hypothetical protein